MTVQMASEPRMPIIILRWGFLASCAAVDCAAAARDRSSSSAARAADASRARRARSSVSDAISALSRAAEPALGQGFISVAARALKPGGRFYMVANRGLPYEPLLKASFASFETLADNNQFRVTAARR